MREAPGKVQVVYATSKVQRVVTLALERLTARQAVERSGLSQEFPEIAERPLMLAIYGQPVAPDRELADGDRVEILRPLARDPRELRRDLLKHGQVMGGGARKPDD